MFFHYPHSLLCHTLVYFSFLGQNKQQNKTLALLTNSSISGSNNSSSVDAKLLYLRNLMVNYLCADESSDIRGPMERAIGTVLQFNDADYTRIHSKKSSLNSSGSGGGGGSSQSSTSWFG